MLHPRGREEEEEEKGEVWRQKRRRMRRSRRERKRRRRRRRRVGGGWWHLSLSPLAGGGEAEEAAAGQLEATSVTVSRPPPSLHHQHSPFPSNQLRVRSLRSLEGPFRPRRAQGGQGAEWELLVLVKVRVGE